MPVHCSGLSALPIRPPSLGPLNVFHNKILRSFLKVSSSAPIPALYFLPGELPIEAMLHIHLLSLFYNIWNNPETTIHKIVLYLQKMAQSNSVTWSAHLRTLCLKYNLPNPITLLSSSIWKKQAWATLVKTNITVHYEKLLRTQAKTNSKMEYLNVQVQGLTGTPHPALHSIYCTQDVRRLRHHVKFLIGDIMTAERLAIDNGTSPKCKLCEAPVESTKHALTQCAATSDIHRRMLPELLNVVLQVHPICSILNATTQPHYLTQFILDCTSLNLPESHRIAAHNPSVGLVFAVARNWCYGVSRLRARLLQQPNRGLYFKPTSPSL